MASIAETILTIFSSEKSYNARVNDLLKREKIDATAAEELKWLWEFREGVHLFLIKDKEYNKYKAEHFNRAKKAVKQLIRQLNAQYG